MLYLIGLGLNVKGISQQGLEAAQKCEKVYLENYTTDFPYSVEDLKLGKEIIRLEREDVESDKLIKEAKEKDIALLVYGSPLTATTHVSLIQEAKKQGVEVEIIYNASIVDAVAETGLQLYKFGKTTSMPDFKADSFMDVVKDNLKINAHSLVLVDIGMEFDEVLKELEDTAKKKKVKFDKIVVCSQLGTKHSKMVYGDLEKLKDCKNIKKPFCIIIPSKLHFFEEEVLEGFGN